MLLSKILTMGFLLAPEGEGGAGGQGQQGQGQQGQQGQGQQGQGQQGQDMIPRAEAQQAFTARDKAKEDLRAAREEIEQLKAQQTQGGSQGAQQTQGGAQGADEMPAWAKKLAETTEALGKRLDAEDLHKRRSQTVDAVVANVPEDNRALVRDLLAGLEAQGKVKLDGSMGADTITNTLKTSHGGVFQLRGSSGTAIQKGPDGKWDFSNAKTAADVPAEAWKEMSDEDYKRLSSGAGGGGGLRLRGGN